MQFQDIKINIIFKFNYSMYIKLPLSSRSLMLNDS